MVFVGALQTRCRQVFDSLKTGSQKENWQMQQRTL